MPVLRMQILSVAPRIVGPRSGHDSASDIARGQKPNDGSVRNSRSVGSNSPVEWVLCAQLWRRQSGDDTRLSPLEGTFTLLEVTRAWPGFPIHEALTNLLVPSGFNSGQGLSARLHWLETHLILVGTITKEAVSLTITKPRFEVAQTSFYPWASDESVGHGLLV